MSVSTSRAVNAPSPSPSKDRTIASASWSADKLAVCVNSASRTSDACTNPSPSPSRPEKPPGTFVTTSSQRLRQRCRMTRFLNGIPSLPLIATVAGTHSSSSSPVQSSARPAASRRPMSRKTGMSSAPSNKPAHVTTLYRRPGSNPSPHTASTDHADSSARSTSMSPRETFLETLTPASHCRYPPQLPPSRDLRTRSASENAIAAASSEPYISSVTMLFSNGTSATRSPYVNGSFP